MARELSSDRLVVEPRAGGVALGRGAIAAAEQARRAAAAVAASWLARCLAVAALYVAAGYLVAWSIDLPLHWPWLHLIRQAQQIVFVTYSALLIAYLAKGSGSRRPAMQRLGGYLLSPRFLAELAVAMVAIHATIMVFVNLKQYIPAINERLYDSELWRLDAWLHLGFEPAVVATDLAVAWGILPALDLAYLTFFPAQLLVPLLFLLSTRLRPLRGSFFVAYCTVWMLGWAVYVLWPSLGPLYYRPARFVWISELAPFAHRLQEMLIRDYMIFRADPGYYAVKLYYGVAALPSLHVGVLALFSMATWRWRPVSVALWLLTAVTFVGSMALGWHYAVDGYAGAAIAWIAWRLGLLAVPEESAPTASASSAPPVAIQERA